MTVRSLLRLFNLTRIPGIATETYDSVSRAARGDFYTAVAEEVSYELKGLKATHVLDVGTGPGYLPINLARRSHRLKIVGIDLDDKMLQIARFNARDMGVPRNKVSFYLSDATNLIAKDNEFDFVISTEVIRDVKHPVKMLDEIYRVLKPGAKAWVYDVTNDVPEALLTRHLDLLRKRLSAGKMGRSTIPWMVILIKREILLNSFSTGELKRLVEKSKFKEFHLHRKGVWTRLTLEKKRVRRTKTSKTKATKKKNNRKKRK